MIFSASGGNSDYLLPMDAQSHDSTHFSFSLEKSSHLVMMRGPPGIYSSLLAQNSSLLGVIHHMTCGHHSIGDDCISQFEFSFGRKAGWLEVLP